MKITTVGDIHGSTLWKNIKPEDWDKIIFMGDYTDHWTYTDQHILNNLKEIIVLKEVYPDKVEALLGNHDAQYMFQNRLHSCSGWRPTMDVLLRDLFTEKKDLFKVAHYEESEDGTKYLWTHAGVSEGWYINRLLPIADELCMQKDRIDVQINVAFRAYRPEIFDVGYMRYGDQDYGGPLWADRVETQGNPLPNINQIIGHTKLEHIKTFGVNYNTSTVTYVDVLEGDNPEFYELTI